MQIAGILLAAGASSRMLGRDKLLEEVAGTALLRNRAAMMQASEAAPVLVVLSPTDQERRAALQGLSLEIITNPEATTGMASSIKAGLKSVPETCTGALIMPADMPNVTTAHLNQMIGQFREDATRILRAIGPDGHAASPTLVPRDLFPAFDALKGDQGGRAVLKNYSERTVMIELRGLDPTRDLDTPEDWADWRKNQHT